MSLGKLLSFSGPLFSSSVKWSIISCHVCFYKECELCWKERSFINCNELGICGNHDAIPSAAGQSALVGHFRVTGIPGPGSLGSLKFPSGHLEDKEDTSKVPPASLSTQQLN